jgi:DNA polymerase V
VCDLGALPREEIERVLEGMDTGAVWGVGPRLAARLEKLGIRNALQLAQADTQLLRRRFSVVLERTVLELRGIACLRLEELAPTKQQIMSSRSFGKSVTAFRELAEAVTSYVSRAAEKLRAQHSEAGAVYVMIRTNVFKDGEPQYSNSRVLALPEPTADTRILVKAALHGLRRLYRPGYRYAKAGVMLMELTAAGRTQMDLFAAQGRPEPDGRLMAVMDRINRHFGRDTLILAGAGLHKRWAMRQAHRSPRYTTRWDELPVARC